MTYKHFYRVRVEVVTVIGFNTDEPPTPTELRKAVYKHIDAGAVTMGEQLVVLSEEHGLVKI